MILRLGNNWPAFNCRFRAPVKYGAHIRNLLVAWSKVSKTMADVVATLGYTPLNPSNNLSDVGSAAARTNLGLGTAATKDVAASGNASPSQVVKGDDTRLTDSRSPSGSFTSASATGRYIITGKKVTVRVWVTITTAGTTAGHVDVSLPAAARDDQYQTLSGVEVFTTGKALSPIVLLNAATVRLRFYDNTSAIASGNVLVAEGVYESQ